jgi:hypothetical protein
MKQTKSLSASDEPLCSHSFLFCDGCGKIHEDKEDFLMCDCGRVGVRMEWATPAQIAESEFSELFKMPMPKTDRDYRRALIMAYLMGQTSQDSPSDARPYGCDWCQSDASRSI